VQIELIIQVTKRIIAFDLDEQAVHNEELSDLNFCIGLFQMSVTKFHSVEQDSDRIILNGRSGQM
jgi:hypothetical protein